MKRHAAALLALLSAATAAHAQEPAGAAVPVTAAAPATGPVTVTADRAEFEKSGSMVYVGNVQLQSDALRLAGDRLVLQQFENGQYLAQVSGAPARLAHSGLATGNEAPEPVNADAQSLNYDTRTGVIEITGKARMTRGKDEINGEHIRYNVTARRIEAAGGVKIVIQPTKPAADAKP